MIALLPRPLRLFLRRFWTPRPLTADDACAYGRRMATMLYAPGQSVSIATQFAVAITWVSSRPDLHRAFQTGFASAWLRRHEQETAR